MGFLNNVLRGVKTDMQYRAQSGVSQGVSKTIQAGISTVKSQPKQNTCPKCKKQFQPGTKFCPSCGLKLFVTCKNCNTDYSLGNKFCQKCGNQLN